ncbi:MAG: GGDEF domain-containing protein [Gammaproteobacteria bacterium]|nr:GGDEF domain-containing protein [Gammaproteobacteria bacterium]
MIRINKISTKIILAIGALWLPFVIVGVWYDMEQAKKLALNEVLRWGTSSGETVRIALNTLMREGKMDARFNLFNDLSTEISELESIRVIRSPKVNEIFRRVRMENDIPRERENLRLYREQITDLLGRLDHATDPDEREDIVNDITDISYEINHSEELILKFGRAIPIDPREAAQDEVDRQVLETGTTAYVVEQDRMRIIAPYKVRKTGCSEASGCHFYAKEGDVLGAVNMVFSIERINHEVLRNMIASIILKVLASIVIFALVYAAINLIVIKNLDRLTQVMRKIASGDLSAHVALKRRKSDLGRAGESIVSTPDELDYLIDGFNTMAEKLKHDQDELEKLAAYDSLTGLYNRRKFTSSLQEEVARYRNETHALSLIIIDLDHFKNINDTYGHQVGDEALRSVIGVVNSHMRRNDISALYGGEEIAVILPRTDGEEAMVLAERVRRAIEEHGIEYEPGKTLHITASIGVATLTSEPVTDNALIQAADAALYAAKRDGRNCVRGWKIEGKEPGVRPAPHQR